MRVRSSFRAARLLAAAVLLAAAGCDRRSGERAPAVEFLVSAGDSTYWVRPTANGLRLRGSPILLARFDQRFHEVYVTDDDRSYDDATFVGQRVWRRDLMRGDSVLVFEDTIVPRLARQWAVDHPDARLLESDEEPGDEPATVATADVSVIDVHGPYLSYEYHADVEREGETAWHTTRRGVVDLRSGRPVSVADLFGPAAARRATMQARREYLAAIDSLTRSTDRRARSVAATLRQFAFDPASFSLAGAGDAPAVAFHVPGRGAGEAGDVALPIAPVRVPMPPWWTTIRPALPSPSPDSLEERWQHAGWTVTAEYEGDRARLRLQQPRRVWPIGTVQGPVHQLHWLDPAGADSLVRRGLRRAFDEAAFYDETIRTASYRPSATRPPRPRCMPGRSMPAAPRRGA